MPSMSQALGQQKVTFEDVRDILRQINDSSKSKFAADPKDRTISYINDRKPPRTFGQNLSNKQEEDISLPKKLLNLTVKSIAKTFKEKENKDVWKTIDKTLNSGFSRLEKAINKLGSNPGSSFQSSSGNQGIGSYVPSILGLGGSKISGRMKGFGAAGLAMGAADMMGFGPESLITKATGSQVLGSIGGGALTGAATGAALGGPWGALGGGLIGAGMGAADHWEEIQTYFQQQINISGTIQRVLENIDKGVSKAADFLSDAVDFLESLWDKISGGAATLATKAWEGIKSGAESISQQVFGGPSDPNGVGGSGAKQTSQQRQDAILEARQFFMSKGLSEAQTNGVIGNLLGESQLNPNAINKNDAGPGKDSVGIMQWNRERLKGLYDFAQQKQMDPNALRTQLEYAWHERNTTEKPGWDKALAGKNQDEVAAGFMRHVERPASVDPTHRQQYAREVQDVWNNPEARKRWEEKNGQQVTVPADRTLGSPNTTPPPSPAVTVTPNIPTQQNPLDITITPNERQNPMMPNSFVARQDQNPFSIPRGIATISHMPSILPPEIAPLADRFTRGLSLPGFGSIRTQDADKITASPLVEKAFAGVTGQAYSNEDDSNTMKFGPSSGQTRAVAPPSLDSMSLMPPNYGLLMLLVGNI